MDATLDVVDLTAVMPGYRPIAQLYTGSGTTVDRAGLCARKTRNSLLKFSNIHPSRGGFPGRGAAKIRWSCIGGG